MTTELVKLEAAKRMLAEAETIDEIKDIIDKAEALRAYAKKAEMGLEAQNTCADIKIQAERKAGHILDEMNLKPGPTPKIDSPIMGPINEPKLTDLGINKNQSSRWQLAAKLPDDEYEQYKARCNSEGQELTSAGVRRLAAREEPAPAETPPLPDKKYRCIVLDPPWPMKKIERELFPQQGLYLDYPTMTLEEIEDLPIDELADEKCHLYLWVTQKFLPVGLKLVSHWGFKYQCLMTWRKNTGFTPFSWMYDTEHVIYAHRGGLKLDKLGLRLSFFAAVDGHSVKPSVFYDERVILASPEPRIEMFARKKRHGFEVWGNEVRELQNK